MLKSKNSGARRRLVQYVHTVDGETEAQREEGTYPGTHGSGGNTGVEFGFVVLDFLPPLAAGMNIPKGADCDLDVSINALQGVNAYGYVSSTQNCLISVA